MSDVPLGSFPERGAWIRARLRLLTTKIRGDQIETFSVGYGEEAFSELRYAREVAKHIGSDHHEVRMSREEFFESLPRLIWHEDEPIVWPSSVSLYFVARLAREHVTVVLTGEGSDETLAGYTRYAWTLLNSRMDGAYRAVTTDGLRRLYARPSTPVRSARACIASWTTRSWCATEIPGRRSITTISSLRFRRPNNPSC